MLSILYLQGFVQQMERHVVSGQHQLCCQTVDKPPHLEVLVQVLEYV